MEIENHKLEQLITDNYKQELQQLVGIVNNISLTGDIVIDSLINKYYTVAQE